VLKWAVEGHLVPTLTTAGGHHRWDLDDVREQIREMNRKQREERDRKREQRERERHSATSDPYRPITNGARANANRAIYLQP
jgi:23S rRNA G2445 N2-methylase RlmL